MKDIPDLLEGLGRTPNVLSQLVKAIPENILDLRRGDGFWTMAEHVSHLAQVQSMLFDRIQRFIHKDQPEFLPYIPGEGQDDPDTPERMDMAAALDRFTQYREKQLMLLEGRGDAIWQRTATHPEYDIYSLYILARHIHYERLLLQPERGIARVSGFFGKQFRC